MIELAIIVSGRECRRIPMPEQFAKDQQRMERLARVLRYALPIIAREGPVVVLAHCPNGVTRIIANMRSRVG